MDLKNLNPLDGRDVRLEPLTEAHREALRRAADDERIWTHTLVNGRGPGLDGWFEAAMAQQAAGQQLPFAVRRLADGALVGSTSFLDPSVRHRRVEIGSTWYHPSVWATRINPACKLLLLRHAFDTWRAQRVSFCTDARNVRSQAAIAKLGAVREGVLRCHMVTQGGFSRDTVTFSITAAEWPTVREKLKARLAEPAARLSAVVGK